MDAPRPPPTSSRERRLALRGVERRRALLRRVAFGAVAVALVVAAAGVVAVLGTLQPPPPPPANPGPGGPVQNEPMHVHPRLAIFRGTQEAVLPADIGINPERWADHTLDPYSQDGMGMSPLHTHDSSGDIHVESTVTRAYTLGEFFAVWGQPLGPGRTVDLVPDLNHTLTLTVDGAPSDAWGNLVLQGGQLIEVHYDEI